MAAVLGDLASLRLCGKPAIIPGEIPCTPRGGIVEKEGQPSATKPPLQWTGVLFALAANLLLPTAMEALAGPFNLGTLFWILVGLVAPLLAGWLTARYTGVRGGLHAFLGGLISVPILGFFVFPNQWQLAILAGAFCTLAGAVTELAMRRGKG
jgi:hypothetical protein